MPIPENQQFTVIGHVQRGKVHKDGTTGLSPVTITGGAAVDFIFDLRGLLYNGYILFGIEVTIDAAALDALKIEVRPVSRNLADDAWVYPVNAVAYTTLENDIDLETGAIGTQGLWSLNNHYTLVGTADVFLGLEGLEFQITSTAGANGEVIPFIKAR